MKKRTKLLTIALKLLGSLLFLWWIIFKINWGEVLYYLKRLGAWEIALYISIYLLGILISSYKWMRLANHKSIRLPFFDFFKFYFSATFVNNFLPGFVGGDSFKAYKIGHISGGKFKEALSSIIMDRLTGLWSAIILAIIFTAFNFSNIYGNNLLLFLNGAMLIGLVTWFILLEIFRDKKLKTSIKTIDKIFNIAIEEVNRYNNGSREIWKAIFVSFIFNFVGLAGANYVLFRALEIQIAPLNYLSVIFLISIISSIPITINNIGIKEWAYITFFGFFGINSAAVISIAITGRIIQMLISFFALPIYLKKDKK